MNAPGNSNESQTTATLTRMSSMTIADDPVAVKLKYHRDDYEYYLGKPLDTFLPNIRWQSANPHNILMPSQQLFDPELEPEVQEVQLSVIGQVSAEGFNFTTTGGLWPKDDFSLEGQKPSFIIRSPDANILEYYGLDKDWENVRRNVGAIQKTSMSGDVEHLHFWTPRGSHEGIRISHQLFEEVKNSDRTENPKDGFNTATWPIPADHPAKQRLEELIQARNHIVRVPEIYGIDRKLMHPKEYINQLPNAIVQCYFELAHINLSGGKDRGKAVFTPRLVQMLVLRPPVSASTPKKVRKGLGADHPGSPSKRRRV